MTSRTTISLAMLAILVAGCGGAGAAAGDDPSPAASKTESSTHAAHGHHDQRDYPDLQTEVAVEPECVVPGETITVTVETAPRTGVLYLAYYSDGKRGSKKPMGAGYGGNGGGYADDEGIFEETWTVAEEAPVGPGRLRVLTVADDGDEYFDFTVAEADKGNC